MRATIVNYIKVRLGSGFIPNLIDSYYNNAPDMTLGLSSTPLVLQASSRFYNVIMHELSHTSHFMKTRSGTNSSYWAAYVTYITAQAADRQRLSTYGDQTKNNSGLASVAEGWAEFRGNTLAQQRYPRGAFEAFNENRPVANNDEADNWFITGFLWDLFDPAGEVNPVIDNVDGGRGTINSAQNMFNCLDGSVRTPTAFRDKYRSLYGGTQNANIDNLFRQYNYTSR